MQWQIMQCVFPQMWSITLNQEKQNNIIRCDRYSRIGGGVCIYLKQSICYDLLLSYSNSVCDLLIIRLIQPELIVILIYRPPSCSGP